jgi:hypothetical protein
MRTVDNQRRRLLVANSRQERCISAYPGAPANDRQIVVDLADREYDSAARRCR